MLIGELALAVGRSVETIKRWEALGFLSAHRDERNRRIFDEDSVERCRELARLALRAQLEQRPLEQLVAELPEQLA